METKANTALIGAFTLIVLALAFVFIYWLARGAEGGSNAPLKVIFQDPVTGLGVGSQVVFNGIKIGDVRTLDLDPDNPRNVIAGLSVQPLRSIKEDTEVTLGFQGLTGVGYVEMAGGSPELAPIWETMTDPTLRASRSGMQDLMAGARTILARADETLQTIESLVSENSDDVSQAIRDVRTFTGALAQNSGDIATLVDQISAASAGIADATGRLQGIVERGEAVIGAVDPEQVREAIGNVHAMTERLAGQTDRFASILERADAVASDAQNFSQHLPALGERAEALTAAIDPEQVGATLDRLAAISAAVDPERVRVTVEGASSLAETLQNHRENIDTIVTRLTSVSNDVAAFAERLPVLGDRAEALTAAIDPEQVGATLDRLAAISAAVDPERVRVTVEGASSLAETLQTHQADIDAIVTRVAALSADIATFAEKLPVLGERADVLLAALDGERLSRTIANVDQFATTLAANSDEIDTIVQNAKDVSERFGTLTDRAESVLAKLDAMAGDGTDGGIMTDAQAALAAIRAAADNFNTQVSAVGGDFGDFSDRGLRNFQNLISEGQRTIARLDRVISNLEQNPSGFIFGGSRVPEYGGQRR
jgi:phospholipid/cholesterol/gamma-HCH transport system substrate-binding protein